MKAKHLMLGLAASVAAGVLTVGTAMADPAPPLWNGPYVGANAGFISGMMNHRNEADNDFAPFTPGSQFNLTASGFLGGGQAGFNWQSSNFVLGVEGDLDGAVARKGDTTPTSNCCFGVQNTRWSGLGTARARVGYAFNGAPVMVYATGGLAFGDVKNYAANVFTTGGLGEQWSKSGWRVGWTAGGGAEWMFCKNWSVKAEVLYVDLGGYSTVGTTGNDPTCRQGFSNTAVIGRAGVNLHF